MTLKEAIERYTNNAEYERRNGSLHGCLEFRQLAEWLKDYKRLLEQESNREKMFSYLDGVADGLKESRNDVVDVLEQIGNEIKDEMDDIASGGLVRNSNDGGYYSGLWWALKIIDKYKAQTE